MRYIIAAFLMCLSSGAPGQNIIFGRALSNSQAGAVSRLLDGEPGFNMRTISVAKVHLNDDEVEDLVILFKARSACAARGCDAHVLLSHRGLSGAAELYQDAYASKIRRVAIGPSRAGKRTLLIDGRIHVWDGKTFRLAPR